MKVRHSPHTAMLMLLSVSFCASNCVQGSGQTGKTGYKDLAGEAPELVRMQTEFEKTVPSGVSIVAKEVYRKGTSGKDLEVGYNIYVKGVAPGTSFRQAQFPVNRDDAVPGIKGITLNRDGLMICGGRTPAQCRNGNKVDDPALFAEAQPLRGEPRRSVFLAQGLRIPVSLVPDPAEGANRGCRLSAIRLTAKFELAYIEGTGFTPNSDVHLSFSNDQGAGASLVSEDGVTPAPPGDTNIAVRSDSSGTVRTAALFNVSRHPKGLETVEASDGNCNPKVSYSWGVF
jgi:hypothetical protein